MRESFVVEPSLEKKITWPGMWSAQVLITVGARVVRKSLLVITAMRISCFFWDTRGTLTGAMAKLPVAVELRRLVEFEWNSNPSIKHRLTLQRKIRPDWKPTATEMSRRSNDNHQVGLRILFHRRVLSDEGNDWRTIFLVEDNDEINWMES